MKSLSACPTCTTLDSHWLEVACSGPKKIQGCLHIDSSPWGAWGLLSLLTISSPTSTGSEPNDNRSSESDKMTPDRGGLVSWVSPHKAKGHHFYSRSGHMPGLWVWSPVGVMVGVCGRGNRSMFLSLSPSLPCSLKINKENLSTTKKKKNQINWDENIALLLLKLNWKKCG